MIQKYGNYYEIDYDVFTKDPERVWRFIVESLEKKFAHKKVTNIEKRESTPYYNSDNVKVIRLTIKFDLEDAE